jgi:LacI family transcriptional regulator
VHQMISNGQPAGRDFVLPTRLIRRESCGCPTDAPPHLWRTQGQGTDGRTRP